jgi:hypothetical protein
MPVSRPEPSSPRDNGAEWVRLRPMSGARGGLALGCLVLVVLSVLISVAVALAGHGLDIAALVVVVGFVLVLIAGSALLAAVGPRPRLWASPNQVQVGDNFGVRWETTGRFREARSIQITWEGQEVAVERGYDATIHKSTFTTRVVTSVIGPLAGTSSVRLPELAMPSFVSRNARIEWLLRARVQTQNWPSVEEIYLIEVVPGAGGAR